MSDKTSKDPSQGGEASSQAPDMEPATCIICGRADENATNICTDCAVEFGWYL